MLKCFEHVYFNLCWIFNLRPRLFGEKKLRRKEGHTPSQVNLSEVCPNEEPTTASARACSGCLAWEKKSLRHVAIVARFLNDNKPIKSLISLFALFQTLAILFSFTLFGKSWRNFLWDRIYCCPSLEKESDNFCVVFTFSIKRATTAKKCTK